MSKHAAGGGRGCKAGWHQRIMGLVDRLKTAREESKRTGNTRLRRETERLRDRKTEKEAESDRDTHTDNQSDNQLKYL